MDLDGAEGEEEEEEDEEVGCYWRRRAGKDQDNKRPVADGRVDSGSSSSQQLSRAGQEGP